MRDASVVKVEGVVEEALPGLLFRVNLLKEKTEDAEEKPRQILAYMGGKMKKYRIRVVPGDRVTVEMPSITDERGRIIRRL
ncbi:translation initiation factor IF-1 [bacterium]|nr:translation initiation factor IF-1 [bacterium]|tara:strand:- start:2483 stop:2725 length:243 start_codon:yes stop_codon:yes gene_type:complete